MSTNNAKPDGSGKSMGTGLPSDVTPQNEKKKDEITKKYTENDERISDNVKTENPNRNIRKGNPTNAHSYKY